MKTVTVALAALAISILVLGFVAYQSAAYGSKLSVLEDRLASIDAKISKLSSSLASKSDVDSLREAVGRLEDRLSSVEKRGAYLSSVVSELNRTLAERTAAFPASAVDASGGVVVVPAMPHRIVSLLPSCTETLFAVGAGPQIVGVDDQSNYPPELLGLVKSGRVKVIGSGWYPSVERILALRPDIVFGVASVASHPTVKRILARYGVPVVLLPDKSVEDVVSSLYIAGKLTGHTARAAEEAEKLRSELAGIASRVLGRNKTRAAIIVWAQPLWVAGNGTWMSGLLEVAGGENVFSDVKGWSAVDPEALLKASPEVIVYTAGNCSAFMQGLHSLLGEAAGRIPAVASGRVYCVIGEYRDALVRPGPRVALAARILALLLHPEAFGVSPGELPKELSPGTLPLKAAP